ncbi:MAG: cytochrome ubiquinol oxidase subunit I [Thermicanus sp.]|nr:cytochrome ubiquinol oxidase subunit I [Thermicanus sp.]
MLPAYDPVLFSRILTMTTLAFHILYATVGVGVPLMIALAQWRGIRKKDSHYLLLARRWTRGLVVTVAVGVVTGTAIGLQLNLLWPRFMEIAGQVISLPLFLETFAFFIEAIFLGIYLYTGDRFKNPWIHFLLLIPVVLGSSLSAFFITTVNAFMNTPQGFVLRNGQITEIDPLAAMFNPATPTKVSHVLVSAYMTSAFLLASIAAWHLLRGKAHIYHKKALHLTMVAALIFSIATAVIGDFSGKFLAEYQPEKLAAAEWHFETGKNAPLVLFGILTDNQEINYGIKIPYALSILAHTMPWDEVIGLNQFPPEDRPPLMIHYFFDLMVMIGVFLTVLALLYHLFFYNRGRRRGRRWTPYRRPLLYGLVASGPLALLAIELGWIFAEVGRQPWILRGYMRTAEGAATSAYIDLLLLLFSLLYLVLGVMSFVVLRKMFARNPVERELSLLTTHEEREISAAERREGE